MLDDSVFLIIVRYRILNFSFSGSIFFFSEWPIIH